MNLRWHRGLLLVAATLLTPISPSAVAGGFQVPTFYPIPPLNPVAMVAGDFNRDGIPDVAIAEHGLSTGTVGIFIGNGDGTFQPAVNYSTGGQFGISIAVADFDGDGKLDLVVANENSNNVGVLLGIGDGTFQAAVPYAAGTAPLSVVAGDFNGDSRPDLVVVDANSQAVLLLNNGSGGFVSPVIINSSVVIHPVVGDFNGDGKLDIAFGGVTVLLGNGDGTFRPPINCTCGFGAYNLVASDVNGDGKLDLVGITSPNNSGGVTVLIGNGDGTFQTGPTYLSNIPPFLESIIAGDLNGDGKSDLVITSSVGDVSILMGNGDGTFKPATNYVAGEGTPQAVIADLNRDGRPDLVILGGELSILLGNGNGTFPAPIDYQGGIGSPLSIASGDLNGDGKLDFAIAHAGQFQGSVSVFLSNGNGTFHNVINYSMSAGLHFIADGDFNQDGKLDLVVANQSDNTVSVLLGNGDGTFQPPANSNVDAAPSWVAVADFNGDGKLDIVTANRDSNNVSVLLGKGDGTFQKAVTYDVGTQPLALVVGDFNGDGHPDLAVANNASNNISVLLNKGDGAFLPAVPYNTAAAPREIVTADFNGDGKLDLAIGVTDGLSSNSILLLLGSSNGTFTVGSVVAIQQGSYALGVGDMNADGKQDLVVTIGGGVSILLSKGDGTFQPAVSYMLESQLSGVVVSDLNQDGTPDLAIANFSTFGLTIMLNTGVTTSSTVTLQSALNPSVSGQSVTFTASVSGTNPVATGTVDFLDGNTVIAAAVAVNNSGQATFSTSTLTTGVHPISVIYHGDFAHLVGVSNTVQQFVNGSGNATDSTSIAVTVNGQPVTVALFRQTVTLTATVAPGAGGPATGTIAFMDGTSLLGTATLNGAGQASFSTNQLKLGAHLFSAKYLGDSNFAASASTLLQVQRSPKPR